MFWNFELQLWECILYKDIHFDLWNFLYYNKFKRNYLYAVHYILKILANIFYNNCFATQLSTQMQCGYWTWWFGFLNIFLLLAYLQNKNINMRHCFSTLVWLWYLIELSTIMETFYNLCSLLWEPLTTLSCWAFEL